MTEDLRALCDELAGLCRRAGRRLQVMEVCGTHTVSLFRSGLRSLLPSNLRLVSGPGCPVCVTAQRHIDAAVSLGLEAETVIVTYGDMLRVPGRLGSLESLRARGSTVRVVNSAAAALDVAREFQSRPVVFLAVGFETTAPATAAAVLEAEREDLKNFYVLACHKLVVPAMSALLEAGDVRIDGFLCPGHVSVIIGARAYDVIATEHGKPCVVAGFEPRQMLTGLVSLVRQAVDGRACVENVYPAVVRDEGNPVALGLMRRVFVVADAPWRALGVIPDSGLELAPRYAHRDAMKRFGISLGADEDPPACRCGDVICGRIEPADCPLFGCPCTPLKPIGPCMVSSEGTCAAWFKYQRGAPARATAGAGL